MKPLTFRRVSRIAWQTRWRAVATVMLPVYFLTLLPPGALASTSGPSYPNPVLTPKNVHVNRQQPKFKPFSGVQLPSQPTDQDITYCHAFAEPVVPVGAKTSPPENATLATDIKAYLQRKDHEDMSALTGFLSQYPSSAWRPSLDLNMAEVYFDTGHFSLALDAWQDAWNRTQALTDPVGQQMGNMAAAKLAKMLARIGRVTELDALFSQMKGRNVAGVSAQLLVQARSGLWLMKNRPQDAFRCGPSALQELSLASKHKIDHPEVIKKSQSTTQGIALSDVQRLSEQIDMPMQMAKRGPGAAFAVPSVIHWKLGHYAALVGKRDGKYIVHDTTFGGQQFLISAAALEQETSGYFLIPQGSLPSGWTAVSLKEGRNVFGRGNTADCDPLLYGANSGNSGSDCGSGGSFSSMHLNYNLDSSSGGNNQGDSGAPPVDTSATGQSNRPIDMTVPSVNAMVVSLNLVDTPVRYVPPVGPAMHFTVQYNQREIAQPNTFTYSNLGPNWTFSYLSYVLPQTGQAEVYSRGGGVEVFYYNSSTNTYYPSQSTQAALTQLNANTWQRVMAGGEIETFGQPDGSGRFFLTQITDPHGNSLYLAYDAQFRLVSLTDSLGQVTTVSYGNTDIYKITKVTDPFGRNAQFQYDASGRLQSITDVVGVMSSFTYSSTNFVTSLTTPYGVTNFAYGDASTDPTLTDGTRWLNTTYPDGNTTRTEFRQNAPNISNSDPQGIPSGMYPGISTVNDYMQFRNTFYWDKQAFKTYPGDYTKAQITHWLHTSDINTCSDIQESIKKVDQNRIWFGYAGQPNSIQASDTMSPWPTQKGRIMDDGSTQLFQYQYNAIGKVTKEIDPLGRETDYTYAANNIDLLTVTQKNGSGTDLLATYTYNNQHEALTVTDASGQTTTNTYYPNGQLHTVTNAKGQMITFGYNASGYLTSTTGPVAGSTTTFGYDGFGRVQTVTDSQGYTTTTNYDAMDRPTLVTYPDGTTSQINYQNMDAVYAKDRLGRWTHMFYNSLRQPIAVVDAMGHTSQTNWTLSAGPSSIVDPAGNMTSWKYDNQNRVTEKDYPDGTKQLLTYENTTSRVKTVTDAKSQVATTTYNLDNTVAQVAYTNAAIATPTVSYTYDPVYPRISTMVDGTGTTTFNYNPVTGTVGSGRVGSVQTPLATISSTYDELGRPLTAKVNDSATGQGLADNASNVVYDTLGRVTSTTNPLSGSGSFLYTYLNKTGRVTSVTNPNGQSTSYTYQDSTGTGEPRLSEIKNLNASSAVISKFDYLYDASGQITNWTQQTDANNPQNWTMQYDREGKLLNVNVADTVTSAVLHQYAYTYDPNGNRTSEQIDGNIVSSSYNNLNQLTGQSAGGSMVFSGTLNKASTVTVGGNPATLDSTQTNFRGNASVTQGTNNVPIVATNLNGYATTNTFQVVIPPASGSYTYDLNGNLTNDGTRTYSWDAKDELVGIVYTSGPNAGNHTEFTYNGAGGRVKIVERTGTVLGSGTITSAKQYVGGEERDGNNLITKRYFAQGEQRISGSTTTNYFYTFDHLGSVREMVDNNGTTIDARYSYDPYGRRTQVSGSIVCDFGFTGYYTHANSGLDLSATRAYDPNTGRFNQRDPSGESSGLNLYAYCDGNPVCESDPSGLDPSSSDPFDLAGGSTLDNPIGGCVDGPPMRNPWDVQAQALATTAQASTNANWAGASLTLTAAGLTAAALEHSGVKVGTNWSFYLDLTGHIRGNKYFKIAGNFGKVGKTLGPPFLALSIVNDGAMAYNGLESPSEFLINTGMGLVMLDFPVGTVVGGVYFSVQIMDNVSPNSGSSSYTLPSNAHSGDSLSLRN